MSTVTTFLNLVKPAPLEAFSRATYNTNLDLIDAGAVNTDKQAKGLVYQQSVLVDSGIITTLAVANYIATFTFKANRNYEVSWEAHSQSTVDGDYCDIAIQTAPVADAPSVITNLTLRRQVTQRQFTIQNPFRVVAPIMFPTDTTFQIKFTVTRTAGTGNVTVKGNASIPGIIRIVDLGMQI